jgi:RNA polymerase-binding protein DksA
MRHRRLLLARYAGELERIDEHSDRRESEDVERATEHWDMQVLARLGETDARALREVVEALRRLDAGTYGVCTSCEEPIGEGRLDAVPTATLCIDCADHRRHPSLSSPHADDRGSASAIRRQMHQHRR